MGSAGAVSAGAAAQASTGRNASSRAAMPAGTILAFADNAPHIFRTVGCMAFPL